MTLTLRALSLNDLPLSQPIVASFDEQGGTIGRNDNNTMALPDPERHISRQQAEIRVDRGAYVIRNVGNPNPIHVRNQALAFNETAPLLHSDRVRIGGYLLEVVDDGNAEVTTLRLPIASDAPGAGATNLAAFDTPLSGGNPFAELFGAPPPAPPRPAAQGRVEPRLAESFARLPDDFDPFAPVRRPAPAEPAEIAADEPASAFADLLPRGGGGSIDDVFGLRCGDGRDRLAEFEADAPTADPSGRREPTLSGDPLVLLGAPPPPAPAPQVAPDRTPDLHAAFKPPPLRAVAPPPTPVPQTPVAAVPRVAGAAPADGWAAFCDGAGLRPESAADGSAEDLRNAGLLLRRAVEGMLQLISLRTATRSELNAGVTVIRATDNNPLKFSPDAQSALEQLLRPPRRGFLAGPTAVADAMNDLVGHSIGTMTGMRAALEGVLERFAPQELETKLAGKSVLDALLPMARKARLWELYLQRYGGIRDEAHDNFHELFGKAFLAAYQQQVERLRREQASAPKSNAG